MGIILFYYFFCSAVNGAYDLTNLRQVISLTELYLQPSPTRELLGLGSSVHLNGEKKIMWIIFVISIDIAIKTSCSLSCTSDYMIIMPL